jgi:hypothetical protein
VREQPLIVESANWACDPRDNRWISDSALYSDYDASLK